jgi:hypothetical protein
MRRPRRRRQQPRRTHPQPGKRRPPARVALQLRDRRQRIDHVAALVGDQRLDGDAAAQCRGEHAAGAGADDHPYLPEILPGVLLHRAQRAGHPGRPQDTAWPEDEADPTGHDRSLWW